MNITKFYQAGDEEALTYRGRVTIKHDFGIVDADECMYKFLGNNSPLPLPSLAHPDDAEMVREAIIKAKEEPQHVTFRMRSSNDNYRYMYGVFTKGERLLDGIPCVEAEFLDLIRIRYQYDDRHRRIKKYRKLMTLSDRFYFEYKYAEEALVLYKYVNGTSVDLCNKTLEEMKAEMKDEKKYTFKQRAEIETMLEALESNGDSMSFDIDGEIFGVENTYLHLNGGVIYSKNQREVFIALVTLQGEGKKEEKYYLSASARDSATGLYNKRAIAEIAMEAIANQDVNPVYLCIVDVDDFKMINDTYGHMAGDDIIAKVAEVLSTIVGDRGYVGRFGGDEFLLVTNGVVDEDELVNMFKTIRKNAAWQCSALYKGANITTSIGIAEYPKDAPNYEELFKVADKCLYLAKAKGKNRFIKYIEELHKDFTMNAPGSKNPAAKSLNIYATQCRGVVDMYHHMSDKTMEALKADIQKMLTGFDVDRFVLYGGDGYKFKLSVGVPGEVMDNVAFFANPEMDWLFDVNGLYAQNRVMALKERVPEIYTLLEKQGTEGYLVIKITLENGYKMVATYEIVNRHRKWSMYEKGLLYISAQIFAERFYELQGENE